MKSFIVIACALCILLFSSCFHRKGDISIKVHESDNFYSMEAWYNENKTRKVQEYMNDHIGDRNNFSFANTETDAMITLDDRTRFYIKSHPGELKIKFDKRENSPEAYDRVKALCAGLKPILGSD